MTQNTTRIPLPNGGHRVPGILDEATRGIWEVKNVKSLWYPAQFRDDVAHVGANGMRFDLYVRESTRLTGPLQQAVDDGLINLIRGIPG